MEEILPPGSHRLPSVATHEYIESTKGEDPVYRGHSVIADTDVERSDPPSTYDEREENEDDVPTEIHHVHIGDDPPGFENEESLNENAREESAGPPGNMKNPSFGTRQYLSETKEGSPVYRGHSVLTGVSLLRDPPGSIPSVKSHDLDDEEASNAQYSEADRSSVRREEEEEDPIEHFDAKNAKRLRDNSFASPPGVKRSSSSISSVATREDSPTTSMFGDPPGMSAPDSEFRAPSSKSLESSRRTSPESYSRTSLDSRPRASQESIPMPSDLIPDEAAVRAPSPSKKSIPSLGWRIDAEEEKADPSQFRRSFESKQHRATYAAPPDVPRSETNKGVEDATKFSVPSKSVTSDPPPDAVRSTIAAANVYVRAAISPKGDVSDAKEAVAREAREQIAKRLGVPLSSVTILEISDTSSRATRVVPFAKPTTATRISRPHYQALGAIFRKLDDSGMGVVRTSDVVDAIRSNGDIAAFLYAPARSREGPSPAALSRRFMEIGRKQDSVVTLEQFVAFCGMSDDEWLDYLSKVAAPYSSSNLTSKKLSLAMDCFNRFDIGNYGFIEKSVFLKHFVGSADFAEMLMHLPQENVSAIDFLECCDKIAVGRTDSEFSECLHLMF